MRRVLAVLGLGAAMLAVIAAPATPSGAAFTAAKASPGNKVTADSVTSMLSLYSQGTDPAGLTGYAIKNNSSPSVVAATGSNLGLSLALGGWKNGGTMNRVFTLETAGSLPGGSITVTTFVPVSPSQPVSGATIAAVGSTGGTTSVTLGINAKRQVNLTLNKLPGNNFLYTSTVQLKVTYTGYTGTFFTYSVPFNIWDGNGGGP